MPAGDSTPNFDFLHEQDDGSRVRWPDESGSDSATDMLPPEEEVEYAVGADSGPGGGPAPADSGESSVHVLSGIGSSEQPRQEDAERTSASDSDEPPQTSDESSPGDGASHNEPLHDASPADAPTPADTPERTGEVALERPDAGTSRQSAPPSPTASDRPASRSQSNLLLVALASYASAVTLALLYVLFQEATADPHVLESLPDVPPLQEGEVQLVPPDAEMPPGHTLALGESRRFGNIVVEPLRVVREPLQFAHFSGESNLNKPPTEPVLKLWVRFSNVSEDQSIAPLDAPLVYGRVRRQSGEIQANQFLCPAHGRSDLDDCLLIYDHPLTSEWDLTGQRLGRILQPGESFETYLPTVEVSEHNLADELVWRVHFRKGYSPKGYGVTTVIEVPFDADDIGDPRATS